MYKLVFTAILCICSFAFAQEPTALQAKDTADLSAQIRRLEPKDRKSAFRSFYANLLERIKTIKAQQTDSEELGDLIEWRLLLSPIHSALNQAPEKCLETRSEIEFLEGFGERIAHQGSADGEQAIQLLKLLCESR